MQWPVGSDQAILARLDDAVDNVNAALQEARGLHEDTLVRILEQRRLELVIQRDQITARVPIPREP